MDTPAVPTLAWTRQIGSREIDQAKDMIVDLFGNIYLAGHTLGEIEGESSGNEDAWIAKLSSSGNLLWKKQLGSAGSDFVHGLASDQFGFLYVVGQTSGKLVKGQERGGTDAWLAKFNGEGRRIWMRQIGTSVEDVGHAIAVNLKGDIYVGGFTAGDLEESGVAATDTDAWLSRYDNHGNQLWLKHIGSKAEDIAYDLAVDDFGHIYIGGYTRGRIVSNAEDLGSQQIWIMKLDDSGEQIWLREFGASGKDDEIRAITTDKRGNVFVTGMTFLERTAENLLGQNVFITKIRANSQIQWSRFVGSEEAEIAHGIATDPMGNIFLTGFTQGEMEEGKNFTGADVFVAKFNTSGERLHVMQLGTYAEDKGEAIAVDSFGNIHVAGSTAGRMDAGQSFGTGEDAFVSKYLQEVAEQDQFHLLADYLQQINARVARIELSQTTTFHSQPPCDC